MLGFALIWLVLSLPGFLITFLIGCWWRSGGRPSFKKITLYSAIVGPISAVLLVFGFFCALSWTNVDDHFSKPLTVEQARGSGCPISLPDEATNIRFGEASGGFPGDYEYLVRFEAPPEVCHAYAQNLAKDWKEHPLGPLTGGPPGLIGGFMFTSAPWFDINNITHGEIAYDSPGRYDEVWVDLGRGVVFYRKHS